MDPIAGRQCAATGSPTGSARRARTGAVSVRRSTVAKAAPPDRGAAGLSVRGNRTPPPVGRAGARCAGGRWA